MDNLEKVERLNDLYYFYQSLLTDKQQQYFQSYYILDLSLQEIADNFNVSKNAVYDQLKNVEEHLINFEEKLKLYQKSIKREELIKKFEETNDFKYLNQLRKMDE